MTAQTSTQAVHSNFTLEHHFQQAPERVFAAFAQPARKRLWYADGGHQIQEFEMDFRAGGSERFRYRFEEGHPIAGSEIANEGAYHDIVPDERIVMTSRMSLNGKPTLVQLLTIEFVRTGKGTDLILTNQGTYLEWEGGPQMIEAGWNALLERLQSYLAK